MTESRNPFASNQDPSDKKMPNFPLTGEALRHENLQLLGDTIWVSDAARQSRLERFRDVWANGWGPHPGYPHSDLMYFQTPASESPFEKYSSRGWKIHIAYQKGQEETVSSMLYSSGLFFKTQAGMGTWFNGVRESGSTIYIGSKDAAAAIAAHLEPLQSVLTLGAYAEYPDGRKIPVGSGNDIELAPQITARFDVAKTEFGRYGNKKYHDEAALRPWEGGQGLPLLRNDLGQDFIEARDSNNLAALLPLQEKARQELIKDFGEDFVLGTGVNRI